MKNVKTLTATILIGMGLLMGGCGTNQQTAMQAQPTQTQTSQQTEGISLMKAIDLADKGQFTPQKVKFEGDVQDKVFGDEPYITAVAFIKFKGQNRIVHIQITDPQIIKNVANWQEEHRRNYAKGTATIDVHEITFKEWSIEVK